MLAELHAGRNSQLHHSQSLVLDVDEGLESLRLESSSRRDDESPLDADDFRLEDGFRRANGDLEEGGDPDDDTPTPRSQARRARATMRYTMKQLGKVGRRDSGMSPSKPKPVLHPKVKKVAEQFFEKVRSADPVERINSVLSSTRREFKSSAHTVIMLMVGFSLCNIAWHVLLSWFLVKHEGSVGWILMAPTGFFYVLVAAVVALALSSVNSIDVNVKVQAAGLRRVWEGVKEAEQTFWEQSESVAEHIQTLEQLVKRLENPAKSAMDEALEIVTDKVRARVPPPIPPPTPPPPPSPAAPPPATATTALTAAPPVVSLAQGKKLGGRLHRAVEHRGGRTAVIESLEGRVTTLLQASRSGDTASIGLGAARARGRAARHVGRRRHELRRRRRRRRELASINGGGGASGEASPRRPGPPAGRWRATARGGATSTTRRRVTCPGNLRRPRRAIRPSRSGRAPRRPEGSRRRRARAREDGARARRRRRLTSATGSLRKRAAAAAEHAAAQ